MFTFIGALVQIFSYSSVFATMNALNPIQDTVNNIYKYDSSIFTTADIANIIGGVFRISFAFALIGLSIFRMISITNKDP
jgi:hypothetical protein